MITNEDEDIEAVRMTLEIVWNNLRRLMHAQLRAKESRNLYCRCGEQAKKIRARRANWNPCHRWAA